VNRCCDLRRVKGASVANLQGFVTIASLLCAIVLSCGPSVGRSQEGSYVTADVTLPAYIKAKRHASGESIFSFPALEIYDASGHRVYQGKQSAVNAGVLRNIQSSMKGLSSQPGNVSLSELVNAIPQLQLQKSKLLYRGQPVVVSVVMENCHACLVQEAALQDVKNRLLDQSVTLLAISVSQP
jgi:hypothetical protein